MLASIKEHIKIIRKEINLALEQNEEVSHQYDLLKTIPGISDATALAILAQLPPIEGFSSAREVAAFAGLTPSHSQSGTSLYKKAKLSKVGSSNLRKSLYMPAVVAKHYNPILKDFCKRLEERGKHKMAVIGAAMRKLLHVIYGVLKSEQPFSPNLNHHA